MWQPPVRWQTFAPEVPNETHILLQQSSQLPQLMPSKPPPQNDVPAVGAAQMPRVASLSILHRPPQQSAASAQLSPVWMQKDALSEQVSLLQSLEQQSPSFLQALPWVLHCVLRGRHVASRQVPLQHSPEAEQG
jgi:hypothetical protein